MILERADDVLAGRDAFEADVADRLEDEQRPVFGALDVDLDGHAVDGNGGGLFAHPENYPQPAAGVKRKDDMPEPTEMPYQRNGGCDLCGRMAPLSRIELVAGSRDTLARVAYICDRHPDVGRVPFLALQPRSTFVAPQSDTLF